MSTNPLLISNPLSAFVPFDKIKDEHFVEALEVAMHQHKQEISAIIEKYQKSVNANVTMTQIVSFLEDLEKSGRRLRWVQDIFYNLNSCLITPTRQKLEIEYLPKFQAHKDSVILMNQDLFEIVERFYKKSSSSSSEEEQESLDPESRRLLSKYFDDFKRSGANLKTPQEREKLKKLNEELAVLEAKFQQAVLAESAATIVEFENESQLEGLSSHDLEEAEKVAQKIMLERTNDNDDGRKKIVFALKLRNTTCQTHYFKVLKNRESRRRIHEASIHRGQRGNENDNRETVIQIMKKRSEKAKLLGFENFASFALSREMAGTTAAVDDFIAKLAKPAMENFLVEAKFLEKLFFEDEEENNIGNNNSTFETYDWDFYRTKYLNAFNREQTFSNYNKRQSSSVVMTEESPSSPTTTINNPTSSSSPPPLEEFFELENVLHNGLFYAATTLYKMSFTEETDATKFPKYHPDLRIFSVFCQDEEEKKFLGHVIFDFFERPESKYPGACIYLYRQQSCIDAHHTMRPIVGVYLNFVRRNQVCLLTQYDVISLFHEFGHTLHALHSQVKYPTLSCTENLANDYVEFPSKVNEHFAFVPEILSNYAKHYRTGEKLSKEVFDSLTIPRNHQVKQKHEEMMKMMMMNDGDNDDEKNPKFQLCSLSNVAYETLEFLASACLDQALHRLDHENTELLLNKENFAEFQKESLEKDFGVYHRLCGARYLPTFFSHIICWAYPATYIGYLLSECIDCDATEWFYENGETNNPANGERMKRCILSRGSTEEPKKLLWEFFGGREVRIEPLLMRRGLIH